VSVTLINASNWIRQNHYVNAVVYQVGGDLPACISVQQALEPVVWLQRQGAFANLIADIDNEEFVLVRDHFGCAPFYYYYDARYLIFGSNLPDLINSIPHEVGLNSTQLISLFTATQTYSDETFYRQIKRVEPGHLLHIKSNKTVKKIPFWSLCLYSDEISYNKEQDYLDRFSELLQESILFNTYNAPLLAGELSGGLDSAAILLSAHQMNIRYPLFMHVANAGSMEVDDKHLAEKLLESILHQDVHFIGAEEFDFITALKSCAKYFAGGAPYIFFMMAQNIHQAITNKGYKILLSGAGGDQCVSSHASLRDYLPGAIQNRNYRLAWHEIYMEYQSNNRTSASFLRRAEMLLKHSSPFIYQLLSQFEMIGKSLRDFFQNTHLTTPIKPIYRSIREREWDLLQGPNSHETRMRVEYSAVLAKSMGFEYRYPLLYPKLVDFCFRLPPIYKRRNGVGRYMIREYLKKTHAPIELYSNQQKKGGIIPATLEQSRSYWLQGKYDSEFSNLPFMDWAVQNTTHQAFVMRIHAYMFKFFT
jgi:asparagine synthase (glutamine-hydrolysing)